MLRLVATTVNASSSSSSSSSNKNHENGASNGSSSSSSSSSSHTNGAAQTAAAVVMDSMGSRYIPGELLDTRPARKPIQGQGSNSGRGTTAGRGGGGGRGRGGIGIKGATRRVAKPHDSHHFMQHIERDEEAMRAAEAMNDDAGS